MFTHHVQFRVWMEGPQVANTVARYEIASGYVASFRGVFLSVVVYAHMRHGHVLYLLATNQVERYALSFPLSFPFSLSNDTFARLYRTSFKAFDESVWKSLRTAAQ